MNPEVIKTIGKWVVVPICVVAIITILAMTAPQVLSGFWLLVFFSLFFIIMSLF